MKLAQVIALYKKVLGMIQIIIVRSASYQFLTNYLTIICKRLISFLEQNKILYCHQYGFGKLHSNLLALIEVTDLIKRFLGEKHYVIGIFICFRKAFDTN